MQTEFLHTMRWNIETIWKTRDKASFMCPTIKKGHSCKAAHADVITAREPASPKTLAELGTSSLQMSEWRKLAGASISNFLGGFFQTRTLQRDPAVALFYSRT